MMKTFLLLAGVFLLHLIAVSETSFYRFCPNDYQFCPNYPSCVDELGNECQEVCCVDYYCNGICQSNVEYLGCYTENYIDTCGEGQFCCYNHRGCTHTCQSQEVYLGCYTENYTDTCEGEKLCCYDYAECAHTCKEPEYFAERCPEQVNFDSYNFVRFCPSASLGLSAYCDYYQICCKSSCLDLHVCAYPEFKRATCPQPETAQCFSDAICDTCQSDADCLEDGQFCCPDQDGLTCCQDLSPSLECPPPEEVQCPCEIIPDSCKTNQTCIDNDQLCCLDRDGVKCCQEPVYI